MKKVLKIKKKTIQDFKKFHKKTHVIINIYNYQAI